MATQPPATRLASLDVLRAVAIFLVLGRHMPPFTSSSASAPMLTFLHAWERGGWIGVDLFFVLSGFLVAGLLFREHQLFGTIRYGHFLARRGLKIYPAFYVMLGAVVWFAAAHRHTFVSWPTLLSEILFVQNFGPSLFPHTWSLAVEEHFYLTLPLLLLCLRGRTNTFSMLPWFVAVISIVVLAARFVVPGGQHFWLKAHIFPTYLRIDSLLLGVLLSWCFHYHREKLDQFISRYRSWLGISGVAFLVPPFIWQLGDQNWYLHTFGLTINALGSGALLLAALNFRFGLRPIAFIGAHSYSIYLWHMPIRFFGLGWIPAGSPPMVCLTIYLVLTIGLGIVAAKLVETPFLSLRDRLFPTRTAVAVSTPPPVTQGSRKPAELELATAG